MQLNISSATPTKALAAKMNQLGNVKPASIEYIKEVEIMIEMIRDL